MKKSILISIATAVIAAAVGFGGGVLYQKHITPSRPGGSRGAAFSANLPANVRQQLQSATTPQQRQQILQQAGLSGGQFISRGGGNLSGQVVAKDATSMTIKTSDGNTHVVYYTGSTTVDATTSATISDINDGVTVTVSGSPNSDGSLSARSIQIRPQ